MALRRHKIQRYETEADIITENDVITSDGDFVSSRATKRVFQFFDDSTEIADGIYILDETRNSGNPGRWHAVMTATGYRIGIGTSDPMGDADESEFDVNVSGVDPSKPHSTPVITNISALPAGIVVVSTGVSAIDTVRVVLKNQGAGDVPAQAVDIGVLTY